MDWKSKLQAARDSGQKAFDRQSQLIVEEHWPQIQLLFQGKGGPRGTSRGSGRFEDGIALQSRLFCPAGACETRRKRGIVCSVLLFASK
jgi:hypothetical protein